MTEEITQEEDFVEVWTTDENGNPIKVKLIDPEGPYSIYSQFLE